MPLLSFGSFRRFFLPRRARTLAAWCAAAVLLGSGGCDLINPDEQVPAYLRVAAFAYSPAGVPGSPPSANPQSALVYVDNISLGIFELPAKIPVLREGQVKLRLVPLIVPDGQRGTRVAYPFYEAFEQTLVLQPGTALAVSPTTRFNSVNTEFVITEDFGGAASTAFELNAAPMLYGFDTNATVDGRPGVCKVTSLQSSTTDFYIESAFNGALPGGGAPIYLELLYRSSIPVQIGVKYGINYRGDLTVFPNDRWTKLYVTLTDEVSTVIGSGTTPTFKIFFRGQPTGSTGDYFALDDVRLVRSK